MLDAKRQFDSTMPKIRRTGGCATEARKNFCKVRKLFADREPQDGVDLRGGVQMVNYITKRSLGFLAGGLGGNRQSEGDYPNVFVANAVKKLGDGKEAVMATSVFGGSTVDHAESPEDAMAPVFVKEDSCRFL